MGTEGHHRVTNYDYAMCAWISINAIVIYGTGRTN